MGVELICLSFRFCNFHFSSCECLKRPTNKSSGICKFKHKHSNLLGEKTACAALLLNSHLASKFGLKWFSTKNVCRSFEILYVLICFLEGGQRFESFSDDL